MFPRLFTVPFPTFDLPLYFFTLHLGPFIVHTYGALLAVAFLVGLWVAHGQAKRAGLDAGKITDLAVYVLIAGLVGAKLMLMAVDYRYYSNNPREILSMFKVGGVFYGGLLGGLVVAFWLARRYDLPLWPTADVLAPGVIIGQAIGRLGCFAAGCCYGKVAAVPWAVAFRDVYAAREVGTPLDTPLHPVQIYESLAAFLIFGILLWMAPRKRFHGQVVLAYVALYAVARFALEFFRGDAERGSIGPFSTSQAVAALLLLGAAVVYWRLRGRQRPGASPSASATPA